MLILKKVAVTGGLSSGKSTVCEIFNKLGAFVISADAVVHNLLSSQSPLESQLIELLGEECRKGRAFDREEIAHRAFVNPQLLKALEAVLHPAVLDEIERRYHQIKDRCHYSLFIAEIPLLYEMECHRLFDCVIAVICDEGLARSRFEARKKQPDKEFDRRMSCQMSPSQKVAKADYIVENNGTFGELKTQVKVLYSQLTQE